MVELKVARANTQRDCYREIIELGQVELELAVPVALPREPVIFVPDGDDDLTRASIEPAQRLTRELLGRDRPLRLVARSPRRRSKHCVRKT